GRPVPPGRGCCRAVGRRRHGIGSTPQPRSRPAVRPVPARTALCVAAGGPPCRRARAPPSHAGMARYGPAGPGAHHGRSARTGSPPRPRHRGSVATCRPARAGAHLATGRWPAGGRTGRRRRGAGLPSARWKWFARLNRHDGGSGLGRLGEPTDDYLCRHGRQPMSTEVPPEELPRDVVVARTLNAHLRALLVLCGLCVVLTLIGAAALQLAGGVGGGIEGGSADSGASTSGSADGGTTGKDSTGSSPGMDPRIQAGLSLLLAGQVLTILAAVIVAAGWFATARAARGSTTSAAVHAHRTTTAQRLGLLMRLTAVVGVAGVTLWVLLDIAALAGAVVGAVLLLQVLLVLVLLRARMRLTT